MGSKKVIIILIVVALILMIGLAAVIILVDKNNKENKNNIDAALTKISNNSNELADDDNDPNMANTDESQIEKETRELEVATFNFQFETYENKSVTAEDVKNLMQLIEKSNKANETHYVSLDNAGITSLENVTVSKRYSVETFKNDNGYIDIIKITESQGAEVQNTNETDIDKARFNSKFIEFDEGGEISGSKLKDLINEVRSNNSQNTAHMVDVQTSTVSEVNDEEKYSILLKYDDFGWISQIVIEKKD